jgi:hypothetical protein
MRFNVFLYFESQSAHTCDVVLECLPTPVLRLLAIELEEAVVICPSSEVSRVMRERGGIPYGLRPLGFKGFILGSVGSYSLGFSALLDHHEDICMVVSKNQRGTTGSRQALSNIEKIDGGGIGRPAMALENLNSRRSYLSPEPHEPRGFGFPPTQGHSPLHSGPG